MSETYPPQWSGLKSPQRADARRNVASLLAAAREAFGEKGTDASLEDIARRSGVGIGTLYRHFPSRDELIEAAYIVEVQRLVDAAATSEGATAWEALARWLGVFIHDAGTKRALIDGMNRRSPVLVRSRDVIVEAGCPLLRRAQEEGSARPDVDMIDIVRLLAGVLAVSYPDEPSRERVLGIAIDGLRLR